MHTEELINMYLAYQTSFPSNADFLRLLACFLSSVLHTVERKLLLALFFFFFNEHCHVSSSEADGFLF